ncbi:MAG: hypothetical protein AUG74_22440 [Bacteroidetes bacterium 13_1_20CM_4_60_6]|nr:MAG: hypothetical protein AUG74_22440 [Bacteroidetes bacterium 13_1_20CM_4_60_6]
MVALMDEDAQVRQAAHQSLNQIDPNWLMSNGAKAARHRLEALLAICPPADVERLQQLLGSIGPSESISANGVFSAELGFQS